MFRRFLARVFGTTFAPPLERPLRPPGLGLGLEALEAREVPAAYYWTNGAYYGSGWSWIPQNWQVNGAPATAPPGPNDDLYFDGSVSNANCYALRGLDLPEDQADFASLNLVNGYTGAVRVAGDTTAGLAVGAFVLESGIIDQYYPDTELSVLDAFTWTGGNLNSSTNASVVNIKGNGEITFAGGETLNCGSTINFINPTAAAVETIISGAGTLFLTGGTGITVDQGGKVKVVSSPGAEAGIDSLNKTLTLSGGAEWGYVGTGTAPLALRVINNGGRFYLNGQVQLNLTAGDAQTPGYTQDWAFFHTTKLEIQNGCFLNATHGVLINDGLVFLTGNAALPIAEQRATIGGKYTMTGGTIGFLTPVQIGGENIWGAFDVIGDVAWSGGTFQPGLNCASGAPVGGAWSRRNNQWRVTGTMTITVGPGSSPTIGPVPQYLPQGQQPSGTWDVIAADGPNASIVGGDPSVPQGWTLLPNIVNNVKKAFSIKK